MQSLRFFRNLRQICKSHQPIKHRFVEDLRIGAEYPTLFRREVETLFTLVGIPMSISTELTRAVPNFAACGQRRARDLCGLLRAARVSLPGGVWTEDCKSRGKSISSVGLPNHKTWLSDLAIAFWQLKCAAP